MGGQSGCAILIGILAAAAGATVAIAIVAGNPFSSGEPEVASVGTATPDFQQSTPGVIATSTPSPTASPSPSPTLTAPSVGGVSGGGTPGTGGNVGATGPLPARACTGDWNASLLRSEETMPSNGFTQADVIFDAPLDGIPQFRLIGEPTIEAEQFLNAQRDASNPDEWDLFIDRRSDTPFPVGTHQLTLEITVIGETCSIPLTLVVE